MLGGHDLVTVRRYYGTGDSRSHFDYGPMRARQSGYGADELVGDVVQGDRRVILLAEDVYAHRFPVPVRRNDRLLIAGEELNVEAVDDNTRRISGALMAYELRVRG